MSLYHIVNVLLSDAYLTYLIFRAIKVLVGGQSSSATNASMTLDAGACLKRVRSEQHFTRLLFSWVFEYGLHLCGGLFHADVMEKSGATREGVATRLKKECRTNGSFRILIGQRG